MLHLIFPNISHKSEYLAMMDEWRAFEAAPTSPSVLFRGTNYEEFLEIIEQNTPSNQLGVPATFFFCMDDENILGGIQIRHSINHPNLSIEGGGGGHIGYGLRPSARGQGLATKMLDLGLIEARRIGISEVIISADEDNIASWKTIQNNNGKLLKTIEKNGKQLKIYMIKL